MRIISASRRTDIAAFYSRWFLNRVRAGFCEVVNPFGGQVSRVSLAAGECAGIVFWTRYPAPLIPHLGELRARGYRFYFHVTITGYGRPLEARNPAQGRALEAFRMLSGAIGPDLALWRYDPIVLSGATGPDVHLRRFEALARELAGHTRRCYFSFVDYYGKTRRNLAAIGGLHAAEPDPESRAELVRRLDAVAAARGITLYSCCEDALAGGRVQKAHCVESDLLTPNDGFKPKPTREQCGCVESVDIGAYDTCRFGCAYCYATNSWEAAARRAARHDPAAPALWRP